MQEVRDCDMRLEVKMQSKVTHTPELTFNPVHTHCDLTAWHHILKLISIFIDLEQLHFCLAHKNSHRVIIDCHTQLIFSTGGRQDVDFSN